MLIFLKIYYFFVLPTRVEESLVADEGNIMSSSTELEKLSGLYGEQSSSAWLKQIGRNGG